MKWSSTKRMCVFFTSHLYIFHSLTVSICDFLEENFHPFIVSILNTPNSMLWISTKSFLCDSIICYSFQLGSLQSVQCTLYTVQYTSKCVHCTTHCTRRWWYSAEQWFFFCYSQRHKHKMLIEIDRSALNMLQKND